MIGAMVTGGAAQAAKKGTKKSQANTRRIHRTRVATNAIRRPGFGPRADRRSPVQAASRSRVKRDQTGQPPSTQRQTWLSSRLRSRPSNLHKTPPTPSSPESVREAVERRAAQLGLAPKIDPQSGELGGITPELPNQDLVREALAARGIRYRWGGASRGGFDCSGLIRFLYGRVRGIDLPHRASRQARYGQKVARSELREGDLVFFRTRRGRIGHVGIYIGGNRFVHAPNRRKRVKVDTLTGYYSRRYATARRLVPVGQPLPPNAEPLPALEDVPTDLPSENPDLEPESPGSAAMVTRDQALPTGGSTPMPPPAEADRNSM